MTLNAYLILSAVLFFIGMIGVLRRKNLLMLFFSTEIMLNAVNVGLAAVSKFHEDITGQMFAFFIIGLLILWYKKKGSINLDTLQSMKG